MPELSRLLLAGLPVRAAGQRATPQGVYALNGLRIPNPRFDLVRSWPAAEIFFADYIAYFLAIILLILSQYTLIIL
jgi:hypothetical protein